jgi:small neutral amino acid transporter SnatA (MarC family)
VIGAGGLLSRVLGAVFFSIVGRLSGLIVVAVGVEVVWHGLATHIATLG